MLGSYIRQRYLDELKFALEQEKRLVRFGVAASTGFMHYLQDKVKEAEEELRLCQEKEREKD